MEGGDDKAIQPMLRMSFHSPGIRVNTIGGSMLRRRPDPGIGVSLKKSRAATETAFRSLSPNISYPPWGQPERHRQAASVRPRLLRSLPAVHDSNTTIVSYP